MATFTPEVQQAFADTVLPGNSKWPKASEVLEFPIPYIANVEFLPEVLSLEIWERLVDSSPESRQEICAELERDLASVFQTLLAMMFSAYYSNPTVLALIEAEHNYPARPPMPEGQTFLSLTKPPVLPSVTTPLWRKDGTDTCEKVFELQTKDPKKEWNLEEIMTWHTS
jgi:hypothetical protein